MEIVSGYSIAEINIADKWVDKTLSELALRNRYAVNVLIIIRANDELITTPLGDTVLKADDKECSVEQEVEMLASSGFKQVKCLYSCGKFSVIVAIKTDAV